MIDLIKDFLLSILSWLTAKLDKYTVPGLQGISFLRLLKIYFQGIIDGSLTSRAAAIAYSFILASLPFLLFLLFLIQQIPFDIQTEIDFYLTEVLPPNTLDIVGDIFNNLQSNDTSNIFSYGFLITWVVMSGGVRAIFSSFAETAHEIDRRSIWMQYIIALFVSLLLAILIVLNFSIAILLGVFLEYFDWINNYLEQIFNFKINLQENQTLLITLGRYFAMILITFICVSILYYFGTQKNDRHHRFFSPGAYLSTLLIILGSYLFAFYIQHMTSYNALYGSIGSLLILVLWVWFMMMIILLGFELNMSIVQIRENEEKQRLLDKQSEI